MDIIDRINALLKERNMTGAELSRKIGVSNAVYSQWNKKKTVPSNANLAKVAEALGSSVAYLMGFEQKETPRADAEAIGPNKRALLDAIDDMTEAEVNLLLERAIKILNSR